MISSIFALVRLYISVLARSYIFVGVRSFIVSLFAKTKIYIISEKNTDCTKSGTIKQVSIGIYIDTYTMSHYLGFS